MIELKPQRSIRAREYKYHLILSFEDNGKVFYVVKYYGIHKQWWHYEIWDEWTMNYNKTLGYKVVKHRRKVWEARLRVMDKETEILEKTIETLKK